MGFGLYCQAQFQLASSVPVQLRTEISIIITVTPTPPTPHTRTSIFESLIDYLGRLNWVWRTGLHKVKQCLQEFFDFVCACGKTNPSALCYATFNTRLCCFHAFMYHLHSYLSIYFHLMYHLTLKMTVLAIVPGKQNSCLQENLVDCADCGGLVFAKNQTSIS